MAKTIATAMMPAVTFILPVTLQPFMRLFFLSETLFTHSVNTGRFGSGLKLCSYDL